MVSGSGNHRNFIPDAQSKSMGIFYGMTIPLVKAKAVYWKSYVQDDETDRFFLDTDGNRV